jgi:hypothetical protein
MTSFRQVEANQGNALRSTGPKTEAWQPVVGRNAVRHGLTAETVIVALEDIEDQQASKRLSSRITTPEAVERDLHRRNAGECSQHREDHDTASP